MKRRKTEQGKEDQKREEDIAVMYRVVSGDLSDQVTLGRDRKEKAM